ncbi:hypothetical protein L0152_03185 [bacterium]|nr:hypothetical protein [bacterium]
MISRINNNHSFSRPDDELGSEQESVANSQTNIALSPQGPTSEGFMANSQTKPHTDGHSSPSPGTASKPSQEKSITKMKADLLQQSLMEKLPVENATEAKSKTEEKQASKYMEEEGIFYF